MARRRRTSRCKTCYRTLRDPVSRDRGYGPTCWGKRPAVVMAERERLGQIPFGLMVSADIALGPVDARRDISMSRRRRTEERRDSSR